MINVVRRAVPIQFSPVGPKFQTCPVNAHASELTRMRRPLDQHAMPPRSVGRDGRSCALVGSTAPVVGSGRALDAMLTSIVAMLVVAVPPVAAPDATTAVTAIAAHRARGVCSTIPAAASTLIAVAWRSTGPAGPRHYPLRQK